MSARRNGHTREFRASLPVTCVTPLGQAPGHICTGFEREDVMSRGQERVSIAIVSLRVAATLVFAGLVVTASRAATPAHAAASRPIPMIDSPSKAAPKLQSLV